MESTKPELLSKAEIVQFLSAPAATILDQWFESDILKGTLSSDGVIGANVSPYTSGSSYILMHHVMGEMMEKGIWAYVEGGMGSLSQYLAYLARLNGVDVAVNTGVHEIIRGTKGEAIGV